MLNVGHKAGISRKFSARDVEAYVALGGAAPAPGAVPEPMIAALFSYLLGVKLPGPGTNYLKQSLAFERYAKVDQALSASVEITRLRPEKALVDLKTVCTDDAGALICTGRALVRIKDVSQ
ncbi:MAG: phosphate acetyltransferase [Pseudomonadota bacterium]